MPDESISSIECARVRIGAALLEVQHLAGMHRAAMHRLERAYMDLGAVTESWPHLASSDRIGEPADGE